MAYINDATGQIVRTPITTSTQQNVIKQGSTMVPLSDTQKAIAYNSTLSAEWHKALLWFLGAVALVALAGPAPNVATMLLVIIIVGVLLGSWPAYSKFLGLANAVTGGTSNV